MPPLQTGRLTANMSSAYWAGDGTPEQRRRLTVRLHAGYVDGHVASYTPADTRPMRVIVNPRKGEPYPEDTGNKGILYVPRTGVR